MLNENDIADILYGVRQWLINGKPGDLTDINSPYDQLERINKLRAFLQLHLRQELLSYKWEKYSGELKKRG